MMMMQPFVLLNQVHIDRLEKLEKTLLVSQPYSRGINRLQHDDDKMDILLTDYSDKGLANIHFNAVKAEKFSSIINLKNRQHYQVLQQMLAGDKYRLYWAVIEDDKQVLKILQNVYKDKIRAYIAACTNWNIKGSDKIDVNAEVIFGELFVNLKWRTQRHRAELSAVEKF